MAAAHQYKDPPGGGSGGRSDGRNPWNIEPMPHGLIDSPLDFIFAEHHRQREAAMILLKVADGEFDDHGLRALIHFLEHDFALHVGDEEVVLFPSLRAHCQPDDNVDRVIERLMEEHREDETIGDEVVLILRQRLHGHDLSPMQVRKLRLFSDHIRQHLALENGVLLPIARVRLDESALQLISDSLKQRRVKTRR